MSPASLTCPGPQPKPVFQRHFGVTDRKPIQDLVGRPFHDLGPGHYDIHSVGTFTWDSQRDVSHPAQKQLSNHTSSPLTSFAPGCPVPKPKAKPVVSPLVRAPGPGHYLAPDYWDANWQRYPKMGKSFVRHLPAESGKLRFGSLNSSVANVSQDSLDS